MIYLIHIIGFLLLLWFILIEIRRKRKPELYSHIPNETIYRLFLLLLGLTLAYFVGLQTWVYNPETKIKGIPFTVVVFEIAHEIADDYWMDHWGAISVVTFLGNMLFWVLAPQALFSIILKIKMDKREPTNPTPD